MDKQVKMDRQVKVNAKKGDTVVIHYQIKTEDGTIFDSSFKQKPLTFTIGQSQVVKGMEDAVIGMNEGNMKFVTIPPEKAYGLHIKDSMIKFNRADFPADMETDIGTMLQGELGDGSNFSGTIVTLEKETLTVDTNHPLAGKKIIFQIKLLKIV